MRAIKPDLVYVSASGSGRSGPQARGVAYGTLLQSFTGFAGLNRHLGRAPRVGFAWLDPMCGLLLAFSVAAAIWQLRHSGAVARIDLSMIEAMLWTMAQPLLEAQSGAPPQPQGNRSRSHVPHGAWACAGDDASHDEWISVAIRNDDEWRRLCAVVPALSSMAAYDFDTRMAASDTIDQVLASWFGEQHAQAAARVLRQAGIAAAALASPAHLVASEHLAQRGFWDSFQGGVLPGLPWRSNLARTTGPAPGLGADTDAVLADVLSLSAEAIAALRHAGALG